MQYVIYGADPAAVTPNQADALALQARIDAAFGYPHGITLHAASVEPNAAGTAWGVGISQVAVWSWATEPPSYVAVSDALTVQEINALQPFQYLVDAVWWGED